MIINNIMKRALIFCVGTLSLMMVFVGCGDSNDGPVPEEDSVKRCVLLYAVASNNLYGNLVSDKSEILEGMRDLNLSGLSMMVYQVTPDMDSETGIPEPAQLLEVRRNADGECEYVKVREYSRDLYSTDPERISEVIEDVRAMKKADKYGLILWSHGTGVDPATSLHRSTAGQLIVSDGICVTKEIPVLYSFGSDRNPALGGGYYDEINIDELADAIPDGMFDFIWFDACYMAGIETAYELRDKCDILVAYPTEVYTPGMPYDETMTYILRESPDLEKAAEVFFNYYAQNPSSSYRTATVAVMNMDAIEKVADYCKAIYAEGELPPADILQCYSRSSYGPFYDFGQYTRLMNTSSTSGVSDNDFDAAMERFITYKAATERDFRGVAISQENYSGVSCYRFSERDNSAKGDYYRTLDWYKRVYPQVGN